VGSALLLTAFCIAPGFSAPVQGKKDRQPPVPLAGLSADEQKRFEEGRDLFEFPFTPRDGLGPVFNARTCEACHHIPTIGGHGPGYRGNIRFAEMNNGSAGRLFHERAVPGVAPEVLPGNAILSKRRPSSLLGLGLIEAIPEEAILAHADPEDKDHDGIRGRAAMRDGHVLRFGSQAHVGSLIEFVADALRQEMGLTSVLPGFDRETAAVDLPFFLQRHIPEPNVSLQTVRQLVDFVSLLAPPARDAEFVGEAHQVARGERLFRELACAKCHVPSFHTATKPFTRLGDSRPVTTAALLDKDVAPYSDFLLHDMGPTLNDGITLGAAKPGEYRTPPLWGVRFRMHQLLHDARANNFEQAIFYHAGEAAASRNRFLDLGGEDRQALIEFLKTL
jgi:CxxC motif-containing protein (DUF1111 family)